MGDVTKLKVVNAPISTKEQMAQELHELADRIAKGQDGNVDRIVLITHSFEDGVVVTARGDEQFTTHSTIGLIECAKYLVLEKS